MDLCYQKVLEEEEMTLGGGNLWNLLEGGGMAEGEDLHM